MLPYILVALGDCLGAETSTCIHALLDIFFFQSGKRIKKKLIELHVVLGSVGFEFTAELFGYLKFSGVEFGVFRLAGSRAEWETF